MRTSTGVREILKSRGTTQSWAVEQMNRIDPSIKMNRTKLSAIICGSRKMTGNELLAFCRATQTSPDYFCRVESEQEGEKTGKGAI